MAQKVIIVSNRLPVSIIDDAGTVSAERAIGGLATALDAVVKHWPTTWVGWSGLSRVLTAAELEQLDLPPELVPVQAPASLIRRYYDHFANGLLWPSLHGLPASAATDDKDWQAYQAMNRRFAQAVKGVVRTGKELIWVQDYHLMLVPQYLREAGVRNPVGFFLHTPFPRARIMQNVPFVKELLAGLSHADLVGLQTKRDIRNFQHALRQFKVRRPRKTSVFPIGVDFNAYHTAGATSSVGRKIRKWRASVRGRRVIFSLSRLDYTKGILAQLKAIERFFADHPDPKGLVYKLVVAPSREQLGEYRRLKGKIERLTQRINKRFRIPGWQPIDYSYESLGFEDVVAWYKAADVLLLLPEVDGMNLIAKEYIAARSDDKGMLVISDTMGSAYQLPEALQVEARDTEAAASALEEAEDMPKREQSSRWRALRAAVRKQDVYWWASQFLTTLSQQARISH